MAKCDICGENVSWKSIFKHRRTKHPAYYRAFWRLFILPYPVVAIYGTCLYFIDQNPYNYSLVSFLFAVIAVSAIILFVVYTVLWLKMRKIRHTLRALEANSDKKSSVE